VDSHHYTDKGADPRPRLRATELRKNSTEAERHLWRRLSNRQLANTRFNRQVPIGSFICDFVARTPKLIVEVDGGHHASSVDRDARRTGFLEDQGYRVLRFWNDDVLSNVEGVLKVIARTISDMPSPSPSRTREGSSRAGSAP
jgi:very-short-patch-repair endonuclease